MQVQHCFGPPGRSHHHHPSQEDLELSKFGEKLSSFVSRFLCENENQLRPFVGDDRKLAWNVLAELKKNLQLILNQESAWDGIKFTIILWDVMFPKIADREEIRTIQQFQEHVKPVTVKLEGLYADVVVRNKVTEDDRTYWRSLLEPLSRHLKSLGYQMPHW